MEGWNMKFLEIGEKAYFQGRTVSFRPGGTMLEKENSNNSNEHVKDIGERGFDLFSNHLEPIEASQGLGWKMTITSRDCIFSKLVWWPSFLVVGLASYAIVVYMSVHQMSFCREEHLNQLLYPHSRTDI